MTTSGTATPIPAFAPVERPPDGDGEDDDDDTLTEVVGADVMIGFVVVWVVGSDVVMKVVAEGS
jgi:hypothetical protein